ncbi:MAG: hypothetical protein WBF57_06285 [Mycobacterium sp.]
MRLYVVLASFAAVVGLATPAHANPDPDPDASFLAALNNAGIPFKADLTPSGSAEGRAS